MFLKKFQSLKYYYSFVTFVYYSELLQDLMRTIGKIEKTDWNIVNIEKKMHENKFGMEVQAEKEKVPKWSRDAYDDKVCCFCVSH